MHLQTIILPTLPVFRWSGVLVVVRRIYRCSGVPDTQLSMFVCVSYEITVADGNKLCPYLRKL